MSKIAFDVIEKEEIAWAAGLFEGEGTVYKANSHRKRKIDGKSWRSVNTAIVMRDIDVLKRFKT